MVRHKLDPLLKPKSIAVLGASKRPDSVGYLMLQQIHLGGYQGKLFGVNPKYNDINGIPCLPSLIDCSTIVEHVVFCISDTRLETEFKNAVSAGMKAATIISGVMLEDDATPDLKARIIQIADEAGVLICGGNGMGFYNFTDNIRICGYETRDNHKAGNIALITHSGSVFNAIVDTDSRLDYSLVVSAGQELNTGMADYLDYAVEQPETKVVGLFMESIRKPDIFIKALEKAKVRNIPVIALKVGRTEKAARMAASHSGALVGNDGAYQAVFDKYGVQRVDTIDELAYALLMFNLCHPISDGGLATIHDSGGERELIIDLADQYNVVFGEISDDTKTRIKNRLHVMLPAENPLDAWNDFSDYYETYPNCLSDLLQDENNAIGAIVGDKAPGGYVFPDYLDFAKQVRETTQKPVCIIANHQGTGGDELPIIAKDHGIPVFDNLAIFLKSVKQLMAYRDFQKTELAPSTVLDVKHITKWQNILNASQEIDEHTATRMFKDFDIPVVEGMIIETNEEAIEAADKFSFPVVLKTAMPGIAHKSDVGGVILNIHTKKDFISAYQNMTAKLGPRTLACPMVNTGGVEMILGMIKDPQFGPIVMIGSGGIHAEILKDVKCALPPFDARFARSLLDDLKLRPLLDGVRGAKASDLNKLCETIANFSHMVCALTHELKEVDINPLVAQTKGCLALDGLVLSDLDTT